MDRRLFLAALGGGMASGVSASQAAVPNGGHGALISTYVTNIADIRGSGPLPAPGSVLLLRVNDSRAYDRRSVLVSGADGEALGYLPPIHSRAIEPLMTGGFAVEARVISSKMMPRPSMNVAISLRLAREQVPG